MRQMKDSGVEWIGEIPADWDIVKLKNIADKNLDNSFIDGDWIESPYISDEGIRYLTTGNIGDGYFKEQGEGYITIEVFHALNCKYAFPGDLIFSRLNSPYGRSCILPELYPEYVLAVDNVILRTVHDKRYICYVTQCDGYKYMVEDEAKGTTMKRISRTNLGNIRFPLPSLEIQCRIANYLDEKCAKIDTIIAKQQEVIEKLKEYKLSVITEAVTKGLNPDVPMKDSGIEWIGMIPEHWKIHKFCWDYSAMLGKMLDAKRVTGQNLHPYIKNVDVQWGTINTEALEQMDFEEDEYERYSVKPGDLMICEGGEIGKCAIVPEDFPENIYYQKALHRVRKQSINSGNINFLYYLMFCMAKNDCLNTSPEKATIAHLPGDALSQLRMPAPPVTEQQEISEYLNVQIEKIESMIFRKLQVINKLMEYKKSLIYEVVTGKREV